MDQGGRFPKVAAKAGHYESFYIKACRPGGGQGIWIRHTVHKRPGAEPKASIWFVLFDRDADGPRATKMTVPAARALGSRSVPGSASPSAEIGPGQRQRLDRDRRAAGLLGPDLRRRRRALQVPAGGLALRGAGAADQVRRSLSRRAASTGALEVDGRADRARRLAGDDRPQLGHRARRALGLARGHRLRGRATAPTSTPAPPGSSSAPGRRPGSPSGMLMLDGERAPPRRLRPDPLRLDRRLADRLRVRPARQGHRRPRPRLGAAEGLRRLGLRRPQGPRAQHGQLLGRRPRADGRAPGPARPHAQPRRRRRLRVRHARDRPRHPDPALPGRLSSPALSRRPCGSVIQRS